MVKLGKEQPLERGESGNRSYLDHEAATSISGGSSQYKREPDKYVFKREPDKYVFIKA
jgi:hypothetical protein